MKRFIRYLYEYGQETKLRNVGFVKVEQGDRASVVHIHGKGFGLKDGGGIRFYLICEDEGRCIGIPIGDAQDASPALNARLGYTVESVGVPENYGRICGVLLLSPDGRRFAAVWNEEQQINLTQMQEWRAETEVSKSRENEPDPEERREFEPEIEERRDRREEEPVEERERREFEPEIEERRDRREEEPVEELEKMVTEEAAPRWKITKIQRGEISILPRCEWRLANNNFLMHGYYNYRHLVLIDDGDALKIGVPGIYHEKEARAAAAFGFPEFIGEEDTNIILKPEERNMEQQFGYWCRQVRRPNM